jgi:hypothetical protein
MAHGRRLSVQHDQFNVMARDHQRELRRAARETAASRGLRSAEARITPRALPLRLLDRVLGPR